MCHSTPAGSSGHADIASASYAARKYGIRNGMWMAQVLSDEKLFFFIFCASFFYNQGEKIMSRFDISSL